MGRKDRAQLEWRHKQTQTHTHIKTARKSGRTGCNTRKRMGSAQPTIRRLVAVGTVLKEYEIQEYPVVEQALGGVTTERDKDGMVCGL